MQQFLVALADNLFRFMPYPTENILPFFGIFRSERQRCSQEISQLRFRYVRSERQITMSRFRGHVTDAPNNVIGYGECLDGFAWDLVTLGPENLSQKEIVRVGIRLRYL